MHIHLEGERIRKSSWLGFWKFQVNETNFGSVFPVKSKYASNSGCIKFYWDN